MRRRRGLPADRRRRRRRPTGASAGPTSARARRRELGQPLWRLRPRGVVALARGAASCVAWIGSCVCDVAAAGASSHLVVRGNARLSTGEVEALLDGMRGQNILRVDLERVPAPAAGLAVGRRRDAVARAAVDGRACRSSSASPMAVARLGRAALPRRRAPASSSTSSARSTGTSICRSSTACSRTPASSGRRRPIRRASQLIGAVPRRRCVARPDLRHRVSQIDVIGRARRRRAARRRPGAAAPGRHAASSSGCRTYLELAPTLQRAVHGDRLRRPPVRRARVRAVARRRPRR